MGDLTKWEAKSAKINIMIPIASVIAVFVLVGIAAFLKPKPPEQKKKTTDDTAAIEETGEEEEVDWDNF